MDASAANRAIADPAAAPDHDEPWSIAIGVTPRSAAAADDRLARAVRRHAQRDETAGGDRAPSADPPDPQPHASRSSSAATDPAPPKPAAPRDHAASTDPTTPEGNPLRAWDSVRPKQDDIGGWRWHASDWAWEDARGQRAQAPAWSKPTIHGAFDGFRIPLDSALALRLYQADPVAADTIAPGVIAHAAAALSDGRLENARDVSDLVPLMQRMTADRQLEVGKGVAALRANGGPRGLGPYAVLVPQTATYFEDGTRNDRDSPDDHGGTNVATMATLMTIAQQGDHRIPAPRYYRGVGNTKDNPPIIDDIEAGTGAGIGRILTDVDAAFREQLATGTHRSAIFGFSRGAASSVETTHRFQDIARVMGQPNEVAFLGLYDPVAAIGPTGDGHGALRLSPARGEGTPDRIYVAYSQDETRDKFKPIDVGDSRIDHVIKDGFPGAHSDVGGSYANKGLSNITLAREIEEARRAGVPMPTLEQAIVLRPDLAKDLLPFLHEDANEARHFVEAWYSRDSVRRLPADVKPAEVPQAHLAPHVEVFYNPNHEFDRRSDPFRPIATHIDHVDPSGRFSYSAQDPDPTAAAPPRSSRHDRRERPDTGIVVPAHDDRGRVVVDLATDHDDPPERRRAR